MDQELLDMAGAQRRLGIMDEPTFQKMTIRHLGRDAPPKMAEDGPRCYLDHPDP
jgi:putative transcriptional regulator